MLRTIAQCLWLAQGLLVPLITAAGHAKGFVPDFVLHVSLAEINVACSTRMSVVVNGTSPGPAIHLPAGKTSWIRVYNDMPDTNFTMVRLLGGIHSLGPTLTDTLLVRTYTSLYPYSSTGMGSHRRWPRSPMAVHWPRSGP